MRQKKLPPFMTSLLIVMTFFISFQQAFVTTFSKKIVPHNNCPYNCLKYAFYDLLFFLMLPLVLRHWKELIKDRRAQLLFALVGLCALSIATHPYPHLFMPLWFLVKLSLSSLLFLALLIKEGSLNPEKILNSVLITSVAAATLQASLALAQFMNQASLGLKCLGEGVIHASKGIGSGFPLTESSRSILVPLLRHPGPLLMRAQGTLDHANHLGLILCLGIVALSVLYLQCSPKRRPFLLIPLTILLLALIVTFSRAALFTLLITLLLSTLLLKKQSFPLLKIALPLLFLTGALFYPQIKARGGILNTTAVNRFADQERMLYINDALNMIKTHPIGGVGYHNYINQLSRYSSSERSDDRPLLVHNIFLLIFAELGLAGLILILALWLTILLPALHHRTHPPSALFAAFTLALLFYCSCDIFPLSEQQGQLTLFLTLGITTLATRCAKTRSSLARSIPADSSHSHDPLSRYQKSAID